MDTTRENAEIWSTTDFPYQCLKDYKRTNLFHVAIRSIVEKDDVVLDIGAGSGILSFFATESLPKKVYAVEYDKLLADALDKSIKANHLEDKVHILNGDIRDITIPEPVDVVLCELIETGLIEEQQVEALNVLRAKGIISKKTKLLPFQYHSFIEFGYTDFSYYGYKILVPKHDWAYLDSTMFPSDFHAYHSPVLALSVDFHDSLKKEVELSITAKFDMDGVINAFRFSSIADLVPGISVGATSALNGDKILPLEELRVKRNEEISFRLSYKMGGGLGTLKVTYL